MKQRVGLNRKVFDKNKFEKTIDNSFEEIIPPTDDIPTPEPTIGQFFQDYATLFYDSPLLLSPAKHILSLLFFHDGLYGVILTTMLRA